MKSENTLRSLSQGLITTLTPRCTFSWWFSLRTGTGNVCDLFCFGHGAAALRVISLSPGWLTRPVGFGCHTHSIQLAQSRTVQDTLAPVGFQPQHHPSHWPYPRQSAGASLRLKAKWGSGFPCEQCFIFIYFFKWHWKGPHGTQEGSLLYLQLYQK